MSQRNRALLALGAIMVLIVAFVALRPGDDDNNKAAGVTTTTATTPPPAAADTTAAPASATTTTAPKPKPIVPTIRAVGLKPVGGVRRLKADKGDTVRFTVTSDRAEHVHLHGYDVEKPVAPGRPAKFSFKATIEGIFEVELEDSGVQLIRLTVEP